MRFSPILGMGAVLLFATPLVIHAQKKTQADTVSPAQKRTPLAPAKPSNGPKPYTEVISSKAKTSRGLIMVHRQDDRYFFEIADSIVGRDILVVNRISKAPAPQARREGYAGDQVGESVIRFEKGPNNKLFVRTISYQEISTDSSGNGMYRSVLNSSIHPIAAALDIKSHHPDTLEGTNAVVVDVTDLMNGDNEIFFFAGVMKKGLSLGALVADRSYIENISSFEGNLEIRTVKTYNKAVTAPMPGMAQPAGPVTFELNSSLVLLPKVPMTPRAFDLRVGYFSTGYTDFDADPQGVKRVAMITRWRLEPKEADIEKYKRGELVEPKKQIVFYIDPTTPKKWVPYLVQGVNDWNVAFERAGWKNAIIAREAPVNDSSWSLEDARHSAIVYKPSDIPNASGPHVHDPRTGEILETHINWYHNVMSLLRNWYFVQASPLDSRARTMQFSDELMGQLIRFVSSHEVGHTLGLRHNFGASSTVPVENLRNKAWVEANGHTPSIMDYARFNYVAQPEDNIGPAGIFPRIGEYDKWAIEWGYRWFPDLKTPEEEKVFLNKWTIERTRNNRQLWFGTETDANDPRGQNEDLGNNAMLSGLYGIKNLKRIVPNLLEWTTQPNEDYSNARNMYREVINQYNRYMGHVAKNIGGFTTTPATIEEEKVVYEYVPETVQKEAMKFLGEQLFMTPRWLLDKKLFSLAGAGDATGIYMVQETVLGRLINAATINKLIQAEAFDASKAYTANEMLNDLRKAIWTELTGRQSIDVYRRNLQKLYVEKFIGLINPDKAANPNPFFQATGLNKHTDALSVVKGHAKKLAEDVRLASVATGHEATRMHLADVYDRLRKALDPK